MADTSQNPPPAKSDRQAVRSEAALRALAEAKERRMKATPPLPREVDGRGGPEPVRYGDWEVNGLASDF